MDKGNDVGDGDGDVSKGTVLSCGIFMVDLSKQIVKPMQKRELNYVKL